MYGDDSEHVWSSDEETQPQPDDESCSNQPASRLVTPLRSQLRPARKTLSFVPYANWDPDQTYDGLPPSCLSYVLEWRVTFNNRKVRMQTEEGLPVAPSDFWDEDLSTQVTDIAKTTTKPSKPDATTITISVNDRSEPNITKSFKELQIDWAVVERQLKKWGHLLSIGKKLKINVCFKYVESKAAAPAGRGATASMLAENDTRLDASQAVLGRPEAYLHVFRVMQCPGPPCDRGPYCWQDPVGKKHYKLLGHHLKELVKFVQEGGKLDVHSDAPEKVRAALYAEEQQGSGRKRKRSGSEAAPTRQPPLVINNYIPGGIGQDPRGSSVGTALQPAIGSPLPDIPGLRDDAVREYCEWQCTKVRRADHKMHYQLAREVTLDHGLDLELVHEKRDQQFYIEHGVLLGVAERFIRDIKTFLKLYRPL
ncbi:hypothetical protein ACHAQH_010065 [Verticillium albo-atrum]